ncbi:MAG: DUF938 domain-containing protein [Burkholderiales bacterium]|nr:MAG: DUF938 domain-containing protein [Burkholderiales bacterium]
MSATEPRPFSPAAERNAEPILAQLRRLMPAHGWMLEIASGTGQHAACFAAALPGWTWQPTDFDAEALPGIATWCAGLPNVCPPRQLDVLAEAWAGVPETVDAVYCANMIHIAPWACTAGLMRGAGRHLAPDGVLITYGPYVEDEVVTAPSNLAFDEDLRRRNPAWGIRHLADVATVAREHGLALRERITMPANNLLLVWQRAQC